MRIVCLIHDEPALRYFVNRVHDEHGVELVVVETPPGTPSSPLATATSVLRSAGPVGLADALRGRVEDRVRGRSRRTVRDGWLAGKWSHLLADVPRLDVPSVNDDAVVEALRELEPDLLLDHGTGIVGPAVLSLAPLALNLHWGLSPYYRGTHCTAWALINWDPHNIGVTIHKLSAEIDGGAVADQARATVTADDTVFSINMQLTALGTDLTIDLIHELKSGVELTFADQDFSSGLLTYKRQWHPRLARHVAALERDGSVARMLEFPARSQRLAIVERRPGRR